MDIEIKLKLKTTYDKKKVLRRTVGSYGKIAVKPPKNK